MAVTFKIRKTRYHFTDNFIIISFENLISWLEVLSYFDHDLPGICFWNEYQTIDYLGLANSFVKRFI